MHKDVSQLQVPVHHLHVVNRFETLHDLEKDQPGFCLSEMSTLLLQVVEVTRIAVLEDEVKIVASFYEVFETNYIRTLYFCQNCNFILKVRKQAGVQSLALDNLASEQLTGVFFEMAEVHCPELPLPYEVIVENIIANCFHSEFNVVN